MAIPTKTVTSMMFPGSRSAASAGVLLVGLGALLLTAIALIQERGADITAAFAFAAGYLLHAGVSMIRSAFLRTA